MYLYLHRGMTDVVDWERAGSLETSIRQMAPTRTVQTGNIWISLKADEHEWCNYSLGILNIKPASST